MISTKKIAVAAALLFGGAAQLAACGSDTAGAPGGDGPGACYTTCEQAITLGSGIAPAADVCDVPGQSAAAEWYACVCSHADPTGFVGFCVDECTDDCAGGALSQGCLVCVTKPGASECGAQYSACVSP